MQNFGFVSEPSLAKTRAFRHRKSVPQGLKPSSTRPILARLKPCPSSRVASRALTLQNDGLGRSCAPEFGDFPGAHACRSCNRTDCKRRGDDTTTSVPRRKVTGSNISAKWCGVTCIAQLHSMKRTREPTQTVGASVHVTGRGTQNEKGRVCKALFGGSIPSRASTSLYSSRSIGSIFHIRPCPDLRP